jgi:glycosyltransferase involved in cell wall biosynthesis
LVKASTTVRILLVTGIFPPDIGGPASYIPRLGEALAVRHEVQVLTLGDRVAGDESYPFKVHRVSRGSSPWRRRWQTVRQLTRLLPQTDVALANGLFFESARAAARTGRPVVAKVVGDVIWERARNAGATGKSLEAFQQNPGSLKWRALYWLQSRAMRRFAAVFTPSQYLAGIVRSWGVDTGRLHVIPNTADIPPPADPAATAQVDLVTVARLVPWKGLVELIDLAAENQWSLSIVGDGPMRDELDHQIKSRGSQDIELRGAVPQEQVADEIRRGRVFVLNSSYEGLPHIVLEAKAAGVPVVATAAGGTPETINDGEDGRLVPVGKTIKLEQVLKELLNDGSVRKTLSHAGLAQLKRNFSFQEMVKDTEDLLMKTSAMSG